MEPWRREAILVTCTWHEAEVDDVQRKWKSLLGGWYKYIPLLSGMTHGGLGDGCRSQDGTSG